jgi:hypothetical protein
MAAAHAGPRRMMFAATVILTAGERPIGKPGAAPTFAGAWRFTTDYLREIWKGFAVALVIAAAFDALAPRAWLLGLVNRRTHLGQAIAAGTAALPSLIQCGRAVLRRWWSACASAVPAPPPACVLGREPAAEPGHLVFLFLVAPWQFGVVCLVVAVLVLGYFTAAMAGIVVLAGLVAAILLWLLL